MKEFNLGILKFIFCLLIISYNLIAEETPSK